MRRIGLLALLVAALLGCAEAAASPTPDPSAAASAPSPTPVETATRAPTKAPPTPFASPIYPYALTLPPGVATGPWKSAAVVWDGEAPIGPASIAIDVTSSSNGSLFAWGLPWTGDLASFGELVRVNAERFHACDLVGETRSFEVNGVPGLGERQFCAGIQPAVFAVLVKDGYGLAFRVVVSAGKETVALDDLVSWLDGLTWQVGE